MTTDEILNHIDAHLIVIEQNVLAIRKLLLELRKPQPPATIPVPTAIHFKVIP